MTDPTIRAGRLVVILEDFRREPTGVSGLERLTIDMEVKNPIGSPGATEWLPPAEVHDAQGRVVEVQGDDNWASPLEPGEEMKTRPLFEINEDATELTLVLAPGTEDEVQVELVPDSG